MLVKRVDDSGRVLWFRWRDVRAITVDPFQKGALVQYLLVGGGSVDRWFESQEQARDEAALDATWIGHEGNP